MRDDVSNFFPSTIFFLKLKLGFHGIFDLQPPTNMLMVRKLMVVEYLSTWKEPGQSKDGCQGD